MSTLEDLVRRSLADHERDAPSAYDLADRVRRGRRRRTQRGLTTLAAAAVVVVALTVSLVPGRSTSTAPRPEVTPPPPPPPGTIALGYRGVEMDVPDNFQQAGCFGAAANVYDVGDGAHTTSLCYSPKRIRLETSVYIHKSTPDAGPEYDEHYATTPTTVDGAPAHQGTSPSRYGLPATAVLVLDEQHLVFTVQSVHPDVRDRLMATVHLIGPVDRNGCAVHIDGLERPRTTRVSTDLVPGNPASLTVCSYADGWIRDSHVREGADLQSLTAALNALPEGVSHNPSDGGPLCQDRHEGLLLRIAYPDELLEEVALIDSCGDYFIGDRHGTRQTTFDITVALLKGVIYDGGFPSPHVLQPGPG